MSRAVNKRSKTDTPKEMVGVPVLKLLRQWPNGVQAPPPMIHSVAYADSRDAVSGNAPSGERLQGKDRH